MRYFALHLFLIVAGTAYGHPDPAGPIDKDRPPAAVFADQQARIQWHAGELKKAGPDAVKPKNHRDEHVDAIAATWNAAQWAGATKSNVVEIVESLVPLLRGPDFAGAGRGEFRKQVATKYELVKPKGATGGARELAEVKHVDDLGPKVGAHRAKGDVKKKLKIRKEIRAARAGANPPKKYSKLWYRLRALEERKAAAGGDWTEDPELVENLKNAHGALATESKQRKKPRGNNNKKK